MRDCLVAAFAPSFGVLVVALDSRRRLGSERERRERARRHELVRAGGARLCPRDPADRTADRRSARRAPPAADRGSREGCGQASIALAAGCLVAAVAGASGLREAPHEEGELTDIGHPVRDPRMWQLSIGSALVLAAQISILSFLILFLHGERGLSTAEAAGVFALIQALGAAARIVTGRWSDRLKARIAPLRRLALGLSVSLATAAALLSAPLAILIPVFVVAGALSLSWNGLSFTAAAELAGRRRAGAALGFQQTALAITSAVAPPAFAAVVEAGSWSLAYGLAAAMPVAGIAVMRQLSL